MKCRNCDNLNNPNARFCGNCGEKLEADTPSNYDAHVQKVSFFFFTLLAYIAVLNFTELGNDYTSSIVVDILFALIVLLFSFINRKSLHPLFNYKKLRRGISIGVICGSVIYAFLIVLFTNFLNKQLDQSHPTYYEQYQEASYPLLMAIIFVAVFPAIFEEIAFRGIVLADLCKLTRLKPAIFITSFLFTILHLSLLSFIWILPGALVIGYLRVKHRTLLYGMLAHFFYNSSVVIFELVLQG